VPHDERRFSQHTVAMRDVDEHAAAAAGAAALVRVAPASEPGSENLLTEAKVRDVLEVVLTEGQGGFGAQRVIGHGIDPIV